MYHFPNYYHDYSQVAKISQLDRNTVKTIKVSVVSITNLRVRGSRTRTIQRAKVQDESGVINITWFNQPFLADVLKEGSEVYIAGKLNPKSLKPELLSPEYEVIQENESIHTARITPVYALTEGLKQKYLRSKFKWIIDKLEYFSDLKETLPDEILEKYGLLRLRDAIAKIHFPETNIDIKESKYRLGFDELLDIQIKLANNRKRFKQFTPPKVDIEKGGDVVKSFISSLPYELTNDQKNSIDEILRSFKSDKSPMRRLLQGDVGSGKTTVAIAAAIPIIASGYDVAVMAPTTVLAEQLYSNFKDRFIDTDTQVELIISSTKSNIQTTNYQPPRIFIGTHALLYQDPELFRKLGLVIIDEQHRFGVEQRKKLLSFGINEYTKQSPHYLLMTATPIPRTLALTLFGDLDVSSIVTKPKNRLAVKTYVVPEEKRKDSYGWIKDQIVEGNQIFWICPLIETSEDMSDIKSVTETTNLLRKVFPTIQIEFLHGRMKAVEKSALLERFKKNEFDILVSTSVIEVGIDISSANLIVIEGSERFGLAQLHQLRGRVGRGEKQAYCLLFTSDEFNLSEDARERLKYFASENDGLKIAEYDLKRRGPGEVYGSEQSGIPQLKVADLTDLKLIADTKEAAEIMMNT